MQVGDDLGGGGDEPVQQAEQGGLGVPDGAVRDGRQRALGEVEQVVAFVAAQPERAGEGGQDLGGGLGAPAAFQLRCSSRRMAPPGGRPPRV